MSLPTGNINVNIPPTTMEAGSNPADNCLVFFADALFASNEAEMMLSAVSAKISQLCLTYIWNLFSGMSSQFGIAFSVASISEKITSISF